MSIVVNTDFKGEYNVSKNCYDQLDTYIEKYEKKYPTAPPGRPNIYDMVSYASARVFVEGLKRAGRNLTREGLIKGLESIRDFDSIFLGKINLSPTEHQGNKASRFTKFIEGGKRVLIDITYD